jgi:hypothetical protein
MTRTYDATVAEIAGSIACGLLESRDISACLDLTGQIGPFGADRVRRIAMVSVGLARAIVAETIKTEPEPDAVDPHLESETGSSTRDKD